MLLPRFYDVSSGVITVDGVDVRQATVHSLRRQIAVAFEEVFLFSESVRDNIAYGRPDATEDEIVAAARLAQADGFIRRLPDGYATVVGERGLTLSGGQRQRIALARALLIDPSVMVLDDATSSIDAETEERIHGALRTITSDDRVHGRTTILIAHRQSTLRLADRIVVLEHGRVVDDGTYDELVANSATFRDLFLGPSTVEVARQVAMAETAVEAAADDTDAMAVDPQAWPSRTGRRAPPGGDEGHRQYRRSEPRARRRRGWRGGEHGQRAVRHAAAARRAGRPAAGRRRSRARRRGRDAPPDRAVSHCAGSADRSAAASRSGSSS